MAEKKNNRYIVLIAGMLVQLCAGIIYMWSVFKGPIAEHLSWDPGQAALTSSIMLAAFVVGIIIGGKVQDVLGPKLVILAGSVLIGAGMLLTAFVNASAPWLVFVTYGMIGGLGVGTVYTCTVSVVQKWFPDKRGFATGLMVGAFGFSLVIFAPLTNTLLAVKGVPFTFIVFGLGFFVICGLSALFIVNPAADYLPSGFVRSKTTLVQKQYTTKDMLKTKQFYFILLSMFFMLPAFFILNPFLTTLGEARGFVGGEVVRVVMIVGIASACGRLFASWVSDIIGRKGTLLLLILLTLISILLLIFVQNTLFLICIAVVAFSFGGSAGVYPAIAAENFGTKHIGLNYGCVMVGFGASALIFQMITKDWMQNGEYTVSFLLAAATCVIALILVLLQRSPVQE